MGLRSGESRGRSDWYCWLNALVNLRAVKMHQMTKLRRRRALMSAAGESADGEFSYDPNRELDGTKGYCQGLAFGVSMRQGSRPYMEDVTVAAAVPGHESFTVRVHCALFLSEILLIFFHSRFSAYSMGMGAKRQQILRRTIFLVYCPNSSLLKPLIPACVSLVHSKSLMNCSSVAVRCILQF